MIDLSTCALRAGLHVPFPNIGAATLKAQPSYFASVGRSHIGYDATHHDVLDGLAVGAVHSHYLLAEQASPFIDIGFIAALVAAVFPFPGHKCYFA